MNKKFKKIKREWEIDKPREREKEKCYLWNVLL